MITIDDLPCLDAVALRAACIEAGLPYDSFAAANSLACSTGCMPGRGWIVVNRDTLDDLDPADSDSFRELVIGEGPLPLTLSKLLIVGHCECVVPGADDQPEAAYLVELADKRWLQWDRGTPISKAYNCRLDSDGTLVTSTLNSGVAWTWQQILTDIWPSSVLGTAPTLPFTPDGTPGTFWWQGEYPLNCVHYLLTRLACTLVYDPIGDDFKIVRQGLQTDASSIAATGLIAIHKAAGDRLHNRDPITGRTAAFPEKIRVEFRVKKPYTDGTLPYYKIDTTVATPAAATVAKGTMLLLQDDMIALWDGASITNAAGLTTRAAERVADWIRKRTYYDTDKLLVFDQIIDFTGALGANWKAVAWDYRDGLKTELRASSVRDRSLEDWTRHETMDTVSTVCPTESATVVTGVAGNGLTQTGNNISLNTNVYAGAIISAFESFI
jgi:hypothetical protein